MSIPPKIFADLEPASSRALSSTRLDCADLSGEDSRSALLLGDGCRALRSLLFLKYSPELWDFFTVPSNTIK